MISGTLAPASSQPLVRYKRCPECGDVSIMSAPICSCCDRTFVTTARYSRQSPYANLVAALMPNPYLQDDFNDFAVLSGQKPSAPKVYTPYNPIAVTAAILALPWLGMILNGQKAKGVLSLLISLFGLAGGLLVVQESKTVLLFVVIAAVGCYLVGLVDVICISNRLKANELVREWDWF